MDLLDIVADSYKKMEYFKNKMIKYHFKFIVFYKLNEHTEDQKEIIKNKFIKYSHLYNSSIKEYNNALEKLILEFDE